MKCEELMKYGMDDPTIGDDYEMYRVADVDEAIAELKACIHELASVPQTDNSAVIELLSDELEKLRPMEAALEIAEADNKKYIKRIKELEAENYRLKKKMDDYHLMSDIRRAKIKELKRALWSARADKAESEARGWYHSDAYIIKYDGLHNIKGVLYGKGFKRYPDEWIKLWIKIESLCRAKAKECK